MVFCSFYYAVLEFPIAGAICYRKIFILFNR